jgi:hypothetical protein
LFVFRPDKFGLQRCQILGLTFLFIYGFDLTVLEDALKKYPTFTILVLHVLYRSCQYKKSLSEKKVTTQEIK